MRRFNKAMVGIALAGGLLFCGPLRAAPTSILLPPPPGEFGFFLDATGTSRQALLIDGVAAAFKYEDFLSYSTIVLDQMRAAGFIPFGYVQPTSEAYRFTTGTGGLDVLLFSGAGGQDNQGAGPGGCCNLEDPVDAPGGSATSFSGWWGQNDQDNDGVVENPPGPHTTPLGPVTVQQVLDYLHAFDPNRNIPVFYLDLNQPGSAASLLISARVCIEDDGTGAEKYCWNLDASDPLTGGDGVFQEIEKALAFGDFSFVGDSGTVYSGSNNTGSGKADFIAFAPTMDLMSGLGTTWDGNDHFVVQFHFDGMAGGFEEIFLTGLASQQQAPEPGSLSLLALALLGLVAVSRRGRRKPA
jgi:PEP-CTERM motif